VLPCGIGHVYDNEHSYPTPNADIGMILRRGDFWTLDGRRTGKPALAKKRFEDEGNHDRPKFSGVD